MIADPQSQKILSRLQTICARQECCSSDMYTKALKRLRAGFETADSPSVSSGSCSGSSNARASVSSPAQSGDSSSSLEQRAAEIVAALVADGYVDDLRYAGAFVREKSTITGWGPVKIRFALRAKGISDDLISEALESVEPEKADDRLERLLLNKAHSLGVQTSDSASSCASNQSGRYAQDGVDPQARLKLIRFALSRGYDYPTVQRVMHQLGL